jgi:hypothetical protein
MAIALLAACDNAGGPLYDESICDHMSPDHIADLSEKVGEDLEIRYGSFVDLPDEALGIAPDEIHDIAAVVYVGAEGEEQKAVFVSGDNSFSVALEVPAIDTAAAELGLPSLDVSDTTWITETKNAGYFDEARACLDNLPAE